MKPDRLVLATGNPGKLRELQALLAPLNINVQAQSDFDVPEAQETGATFIENALLKARNACRHTGLPALADDSGLIVDALDGAPGIYSSRYAGLEAGDEDNRVKLLRALEGVPETGRGARFHCTLVLLRSEVDPAPLILEGRWEGKIAQRASGERGFGYDPIFVPDGMKSTAAKLDPAEKNRVSHRGRALGALIGLLEGE